MSPGLTPRTLSHTQSPKFREFTRCPATQPLINAYGDLALSTREFLIYDTSFKQFPEKFSILTNIFQDYCTQTSSALGMVNKTLQIPSILVNTSKNLQKAIAEVFSSYESIVSTGSQPLVDEVKLNFKNLNSIIKVIESSVSKEHFYDDSVVIGLPKIKKTLQTIKQKATTLLQDNPSEDALIKYTDKTKAYIREFTSFIDKDLPPAIFTKSKKIKMRNDVTALLGKIATIITTASQYPDQLAKVGENLKTFASIIDETNKTMNIQ